MGVHVRKPRASEPLRPISYGSPSFRSVEAGGLLVTDAYFPPHSRLPRHVHDRTCVAVPLDGAFDSEMRGRSHWSPAGTLITEPAGEAHANRFGSTGARIAIVQPDMQREALLRPCAGLLGAIHHRADSRVALVARQLALEVSASDAAAMLAVEALALELLVVCARAVTPEERGRTPAWLVRIRDRLHDEFRQPHDLASLAREAGVHPAHLTRAFRRRYGRSIGRYLRLIRIEWAAGRLASSDDLLADVAVAAGFSDQSHFTRLFRQQFGCTPARYRQRVTGGTESGPRESLRGAR
jgi:AraC family transcriptional regulator